MLYSKYRSQKFKDLIGQDVVTKTLANAVSEGKVGHAYIFSGPRGTGKTSAARILAKAINCEKKLKSGEPCNKCDVCCQITEGRSVDVIEIDAASHTSVDDVRDLIEKVNYSPVSLRRKVYIIDEVHMLSRSAFNALLKTLEEPPSHVLFVLATTEIHKIPITVLSRCQRFDFKLGSEEEIIAVLKTIISGEKVNIEDSALKYIVDVAQGSYRDSISTIERVLSKKEISGDKIITASEVREFLGIPDNKKFCLLLTFLIQKQVREALDLINSVVESGNDIKFFSSYFLRFLRDKLLYSIELEETQSSVFFQILKEFSEADKKISNSPIIQLPLEMAVINVTKNYNDHLKCNFSSSDEQKEKENNQSQERSGSEGILKEEKNESEFESVVEKKILKNKKKNSDVTKLSPNIEGIREQWQQFVDATKPFNGHLYAFISKSLISELNDSGELTLIVPFDFYKERIEDCKSQEILGNVSERIFHQRLKIKCVVQKNNENPSSFTESNESVNGALDVFGEDVV